MAAIVKQGTFRIRMLTPWTGIVDGKERTVRAGEEVDVDRDTFHALVYVHAKAEVVSVEEIIAAAKKPKKPKKPPGKRASSTKAKGGPDKNKMLKTSNQK